MNARAVILVVVFALSVVPAVALADDPHVRWEDVIGIIQAGNLVGSGTGQVTGGGQPWSTTRGTATVNLRRSEIRFWVEGLVLAGGNSIGPPAQGDAEFHGPIGPLPAACLEPDVAFLIRIRPGSGLQTVRFAGPE